MTLAFVDANSKLLDVASVADVDAEELVDDSLVVILNLNFGDDVKAEVWARFSTIFFVKTLRRDMVKILKLKFCQAFKAKFWSRF